MSPLGSVGQLEKESTYRYEAYTNTNGNTKWTVNCNCQVEILKTVLGVLADCGEWDKRKSVRRAFWGGRERKDNRARGFVERKKEVLPRGGWKEQAVLCSYAPP